MPNEALASLLGAPDASDAVKEAHRKARPDDSATTTQPYTEEHTDALEL